MADQLAGLECYDGQAQTLQEKVKEGRWVALYMKELLKYVELFYSSLTTHVGILLQSTW